MKIRGRHKTREVLIDGVRLDLAGSQQIYNHSPDCFSWGSAGAGSSQLALALMLRFAGSARIAQRLYRDFMVEIIQHIPADSDFELDVALVIDWIGERRPRLEWAEKFSPTAPSPLPRWLLCWSAPSRGPVPRRLFRLKITFPVAFLFIAAMLSLVVALLSFLREVSVATANLRIGSSR